MVRPPRFAASKLVEAYDLLMPLYSSFIEGFGAPDLIDAEALLNELRQSRGDLICDMPNGS
jgi:hypothetical protein